MRRNRRRRRPLSCDVVVCVCGDLICIHIRALRSATIAETTTTPWSSSLPGSAQIEARIQPSVLHRRPFSTITPRHSIPKIEFNVRTTRSRVCVCVCALCLYSRACVCVHVSVYACVFDRITHHLCLCQFSREFSSSPKGTVQIVILFA